MQLVCRKPSTMYSFARAITRPFLAVPLFLTCCVLSLAADTGVLAGSVTDPSGSAIAGATVVLQSAASSASQTTKTDEEGYYSFLTSPGRYSLKISLAPFQPFLRDGLVIEAGIPARI